MPHHEELELQQSFYTSRQPNVLSEDLQLFNDGKLKMSNSPDESLGGTMELVSDLPPVVSGLTRSALEMNFTLKLLPFDRTVVSMLTHT